ncbi:MAG: tRNA (adenosine(37)-N6)-threonylcarbamoyltransferase complex ATPase subunit type 1 TsaE [Nitrospinota bacterium]|nr:tRNA (adenosine(37)-N6)-threonylcarbamoyltransferase complex ATPase subunit type 1 TsaE [Nitrospinota bacterium]
MSKKVNDFQEEIFFSRCEEDTMELGRNLAKKLKEKDVVCIYGDLGAGKTCLIKGIVDGLGITEEYVSSPTFAIINKYCEDKTVYHLDFYRIEVEKEIEELGIEEFTGKEGITLIEWPEKIIKYLPETRWEIKINILVGNKRSFNVNFLE